MHLTVGEGQLVCFKAHYNSRTNLLSHTSVKLYCKS